MVKAQNCTHLYIEVTACLSEATQQFLTKASRDTYTLTHICLTVAYHQGFSSRTMTLHHVGDRTTKPLISGQPATPPEPPL